MLFTIIWHRIVFIAISNATLQSKNNAGDIPIIDNFQQSPYNIRNRNSIRLPLRDNVMPTASVDISYK